MFRNREVRLFLLLLLTLAAVAAFLGFRIGPAAGFLAIVLSAAFSAAFFAFTRARYKRIARISDQIDRVLHNSDRLYLGESDEGELAILHSEITKMTLRIREQNLQLQNEKEHLADSLADIAHQLRTPLTSVSLILSLLGKSTDENGRKAFVREAEELLLRMDWLTTSLLKLSRLDAGIVDFQSEPVDVRRLVSAAVRPLQIPMELHGIGFRAGIPQGVVVRGDAGWLTEAVQNILKNCMESAGENGMIDVSCTDNPLFTEIVIHDSGAGFAKEELPRLFDRFYRGQNGDAAGFGIGLALCRTIIMRQGGSISAQNHPQGGAVFTIHFPK